MERNFIIRELTADDLAAVTLLYKDMYAEQKTFGMVMDINAEEAEGILLAQLKSKLFLSFGVEVDSDMIAFAFGGLVRYPKKYVPLDEEAPFIGFIHDLYVSPAYRSGGIAGKLVRELEKGFAEQGISYVELHVLSGNERGQGFWEAKGYQDVLQVKYKRI